jgi:steroid delta-isomerase-like uncharacterized protein
VSEYHEQSNKSMVRRFYAEIINRGDFTLSSSIVRDDFFDNSPVPGQVEGVEGLRHRVSLLRSAFPDLSVEPQEIVAEGERVVALWRMAGTQMGEFFGIKATGKRVLLDGCDIFRMLELKIRERWQLIDSQSLLEQLGLLSPARGRLFI